MKQHGPDFYWFHNSEIYKEVEFTNWSIKNEMKCIDLMGVQYFICIDLHCFDAIFIYEFYDAIMPTITSLKLDVMITIQNI